jgi:hypothetical protein
MRRITHCVLVAALAVVGCGEDDPEAELDPAATEPDDFELDFFDDEAEPPEPQHDGAVVMAEGYPVEVVPHEDGEVHAYLLDDEMPPENVALTVEVPIEGEEEPQPMTLVYSPDRGRWEGRLDGPRIQRGPIDVVVEVDGEPYFGHRPQVVLAPPVVVSPGVARAPVVHVYPPGHPQRLRWRDHPGRGPGLRRGRMKHRRGLRGGRGRGRRVGRGGRGRGRRVGRGGRGRGRRVGRGRGRARRGRGGRRRGGRRRR